MSFSQHFALHFHSVCPMLGRSWRCTNVLTAKAWDKINILGWLLLLCSLFVACILGGSLPFKQSPFLCTKIPNIAFLWCTLPWLHGHSCTVLPKSTLAWLLDPVVFEATSPCWEHYPVPLVWNSCAKKGRLTWKSSQNRKGQKPKIEKDPAAPAVGENYSQHQSCMK